MFDIQTICLDRHLEGKVRGGKEKTNSYVWIEKSMMEGKKREHCLSLFCFQFTLANSHIPSVEEVAIEIELRKTDQSDLILQIHHCLRISSHSSNSPQTEVRAPIKSPLTTISPT